MKRIVIQTRKSGKTYEHVYKWNDDVITTKGIKIAVFVAYDDYLDDYIQGRVISIEEV